MAKHRTYIPRIASTSPVWPDFPHWVPAGVKTPCMDDPELWFAPGYEAEAKELCLDCPIRALCLQKALELGEDYGVWGGASALDRRAIRGRGGSKRCRLNCRNMRLPGGLLCEFHQRKADEGVLARCLECSGWAVTRGLCSAHYKRWRRRQ